MEIKILTSKDDILLLEKLRYEVLKIDADITLDNYHLLKIAEGKMLPFGMYKDNELIAGCYVTDERNSLYIDYIFLKEKYQNLDEKFGRVLLQYIMDNKNLVEEYFNKSFLYCYLEPRGEKAYNIFTNMGFIKTNNIFDELKKRI